MIRIFRTGSARSYRAEVWTMNKSMEDKIRTTEIRRGIALTPKKLWKWRHRYLRKRHGKAEIPDRGHASIATKRHTPWKWARCGRWFNELLIIQ